MIAAVTTLLLIIKAVTKPYIAFLGRIPGTKRYTDIIRHPDNESIPGIFLFRVEASLFYFNVENIQKVVYARILSTGSSLKTVIWDFSTSPYVDRAGAKMIRRFYLDLTAKGISFRIAEAHSQVRDILRSEEVEELLGHISRKVSVDELVKEEVQD
jgi:sulfate permease, SulP family